MINGFNNDSRYSTPEELRIAARSLFHLARQHIHQARTEEDLGNMSVYTPEQIQAKRELATRLLKSAEKLLNRARIMETGGNGSESGIGLN